MAQVKFTNVAKYKGKFYPAHTPFEVADQDVESLVSRGAIVTVAPEAGQSGDDSNQSVNLDSMKVDQLKAYAEEHNIDISKVERKADIIAAIKAAEEAEDSDDESEDENE